MSALLARCRSSSQLPRRICGTIVEGATDGSFLYTPAANFAGASDTFTYTLTDGNGVTNTGTVTINFLNRVWYVNSAAAVNGDGRSNSPFNNLNNAQAPSLAGDIIYVHTGGRPPPVTSRWMRTRRCRERAAPLSLNGGALVDPRPASRRRCRAPSR